MTYTPDTDTISPEKFEIVLGRDTTIENGQYFVAFSAVDKGSGVVRYEVEEAPIFLSWLGVHKIWSEASDPQILHYQHMMSTVMVRAYDANGNVTESRVSKPFDTVGWICFVGVILIVIIIFATIIILKKRKVL